MVYEISRDQNYCSIGDGVVYEFVPSIDGRYCNSCWHCSFWDGKGDLPLPSKCVIAPCQKAFRSDKNDGFWRILELIDYQQFTKMLRAGG